MLRVYCSCPGVSAMMNLRPPLKPVSAGASSVAVPLPLAVAAVATPAAAPVWK
jgi:hypothetical protein